MELGVEAPLDSDGTIGKGERMGAQRNGADGGEGDLKSFEFWWDPPGGAPRSWAGPAVGVVRYASSAQFIYYGGP